MFCQHLFKKTPVLSLVFYKQSFGTKGWLDNGSYLASQDKPSFPYKGILHKASLLDNFYKIFWQENWSLATYQCPWSTGLLISCMDGSLLSPTAFEWSK